LRARSSSFHPPTCIGRLQAPLMALRA
jgi:hypothetical protein